MNIANWAKDIGIELPSMNYENIILQNFEGEYQSLKNVFILLYKQVIFENRGKVSENSLCHFKAKIKSVEIIERRIATKNGKLNVHYKKWNVYLNTLQVLNNTF